ncbi:MAG: dehydrogenase [Planctomycetota bacterium]|nr:MAG: dehydrogenase [Planctomycetota bacterium]
MTSDTPHDNSSISRRAFVRKAALGASAIAAAPLVLSGRARAQSSDPEVLRVGLIGCGGRGTGAALQALSAENGTVHLVAMADAFADRLDSSHTNLGNALGDRAHLLKVSPEMRFVGFDAAQQLIASDVDVVLIATPPHWRPAHMAAAIEAGKHVFAEKPFAVDAPGIRSVLATAELAKRKQLSLMSGFCWRYNVRHREFYEHVHAGDMGALRAVYSTYNASPLNTFKREEGWSDVEWQMRNWQHFNWLGGDHVVEQAVHSLDKMAWAMNDEPPLSVTALGGRQARQGAETGDIYDHFSATFDYAGGVKGFHMSRQMANCTYDNSDFLMGELGTGTIASGGYGHAITGPKAWTYEGGGNDMYQQEHDELFAAIRAGTPINDGVWAARSTMLAIMLRMSAYTGQTLTWDQALASEERLGPERYTWGELAVSDVPIPGRTKFV